MDDILKMASNIANNMSDEEKANLENLDFARSISFTPINLFDS